MKTTVNLFSTVLMFAIVPLIFFIYLFILLLFAMAELLFYIFDKTDQRRLTILKRIFYPLNKR